MENVTSHTLHFKFNALPEKLKAEVLDFIDFLLEKEKKGKMSKKQRGARERVFKTLSEKKPLGGGQAWKDIHQERTFADGGALVTGQKNLNQLDRLTDNRIDRIDRILQKYYHVHPVRIHLCRYVNPGSDNFSLFPRYFSTFWINDFA